MRVTINLTHTIIHWMVWSVPSLNREEEVRVTIIVTIIIVMKLRITPTQFSGNFQKCRNTQLS
jgi:hypothetical protein